MLRCGRPETVSAVVAMCGGVCGVRRQNPSVLTRCGVHQSSVEMRVSAAACGSGADTLGHCFA